MLYFNTKKSDCTGCTACQSVCPVGCIHMEKDDEGFIYPQSNDACIHCGKCERVCPILNKEKLFEQHSNYEQQAYCAITNNKKIWIQSSSGGAFSEICKAFGDEYTIIYGAAWDGLRAKHKRVIGVSSIAPLRKSKYIESVLDDAFIKIYDDLKKGKKVIFCGTPCQVSGLKQYLAKIPDSLLLIDLICHGVGSPKVFETCMEVMGEQLGEKIESYEFRSKRSFYETDYMCKVTGLNTKKERYVTSDPYMQLFFRQDCLRPSCGKNCNYRCEQRQGDITIADFKSVTSVFPELIGVKRNYSSVIINTPKGEKILPVLKEHMEMRECSINAIKQYNPLFHRQTIFSEERDLFFREFIAQPNETTKRYTKPADLMKQTPFKIMAAYLPVSMRRAIINIIRRRSNCEK